MYFKVDQDVLIVGIDVWDQIILFCEVFPVHGGCLEASPGSIYYMLVSSPSYSNQRCFQTSPYSPGGEKSSLVKNYVLNHTPHYSEEK